MAPQRLTIYLYSAHRAVIFAIAQLSCVVLLSENKYDDDADDRSIYGAVQLLTD